MARKISHEISSTPRTIIVCHLGEIISCRAFDQTPSDLFAARGEGAILARKRAKSFLLSGTQNGASSVDGFQIFRCGPNTLFDGSPCLKAGVLRPIRVTEPQVHHVRI